MDPERDAEEAIDPFKVESESEDEQANGISTNTDGSLLTSLKMTCSDNEDPFEDCDNTSQAPEHKVNAVVMPSNALLNALLSDALSTISKQIALMNETITTIEEKTDNMQEELTYVTERLGRVEKKVSISLATLEQVKDSVMINGDEWSRPEERDQPAQPRFAFKKISSEQELTEFDTKLGADEEYYNNVKRWLLTQLPDSIPDNRLRLALDILIERAFFAQCNWSGKGKYEPKVCFGIRTNVFKLFADVGSNQSITVTEVSVNSFFKNKLYHAKERAKKKGKACSVYMKRKSAN